MKKTNIFIILGIIFIILVMTVVLILNQLGFLSILSYHQTFEWKNANWTVYANQPLDDDLADSKMVDCGIYGENVLGNQYYVDSNGNLEMYLYNRKEMQAINHLILKSDGLNINYGNLKKLDIAIEMFCGTDSTASGSDAIVKAYLVSDSDKILIKSISCNAWYSKSSIKESLVLTKDSLLTIPQEPIDLNTNYELYFDIENTRPDCEFVEEGKITISRLNIEYTPLDLCKDVTCPDKCQNSVRYYNGYCDSNKGECVYETETCEYGCSGKLCKNDLCAGVTCEDRCEDSIWYHDGVCNPSTGKCDYEEDTCQFGCENEPFLAIIVGEGMCRDDPCTGIECEDYCSETTLYYDGKCINGECTQFKEKEYAEECGYVPWYKNTWIWVGGISAIIVIISVLFYRKLK